MRSAPGPAIAATVTALVLGMLSGCIDPIDLDVGPPERRLVVQGLVREGPGPHDVLLRRSGAYTQGLDALRPAETGARVTVLAGDGRAVLLPEIMPGLYRAAEGALEAEVGESYALRVELADGTVYTTDPIAMRPAPAISGLSVEVETVARVVNGTLVQDPQVVIRALPEATPGEPAFYRWSWRGTARLVVCPFRGSDECSWCYADVNSRSPVVLGDNTNVGPGGVPPQRAAEFTLRGDNARYFRSPFFITVEQQALSAESYAYWSLVRESVDRVGSLFDPPPDAAIGNVANAADREDYALGAFTVVGAATQSICLVNDGWPPFPDPGPLYGTCGGNIPGSPLPPPAYVEACLRSP